jgi:hypothetical protein
MDGPALAELGNAGNAHAAAAALAARPAKILRFLTGTPVRADLFGAAAVLSRQGEIRVPAGQTTGDDTTTFGRRRRSVPSH